LRGEGEGLIPGGISLVDDRTGAFYPLVVAEGFRLAHSGDVKIYEHLGDLPRAFVVGEARFAPDDETALALMTDPGFDPFRQVVLSGEGTPAEAGTSSPSDEVGVPGSAEVLEYDSTRVEVVAEMTEGGYLVLADAWYPGWRIEVVPLDGGVAREMRPLRADLLFRAVHLTPGDWRVTFTYRPRALYVGSIASALGVVLLTAYAIIVLRGARRARGSPAVS
jgi:hypothetical protein